MCDVCIRNSLDAWERFRIGQEQASLRNDRTSERGEWQRMETGETGVSGAKQQDVQTLHPMQPIR